MSEGVYRALLVGNSTFPEDPHNLFPLNGPVNDLVYLSQALTDPEVGLFNQAHVQVLPERSKQEITRAMEEFFQSAGRDDTLLMYYSGHGKADEWDNLFLCARDTRTDLIVSTGISDQEIDGMMRASSTRAIVIVLDCCHSGAFKSAGLPNKLKASGRFLLTSSRRGEASRDAEHRSSTSAFTRHLVDALRNGQDHNGDGYVSVNEVYDHVLATLPAETKQIPQRHFDREAVGDVALARRVAEIALSALATHAGSDDRPILMVSPDIIELRGVGAEERLPIEIVDVFNEGGGELSWTATSTVNWIHLDQHDTWCELTLAPDPGINRGSIHIRDAGRGGSKTVRVIVEVGEPQRPPSLIVDPSEVNFGVLRVGSECPPRTLLIKNGGGGDLDAHATAASPWLHVDQAGEVVTVTVDTRPSGTHTGIVIVQSTAGEKFVPVSAVIEPGPILEASPLLIEFNSEEGEQRTAHVAIRNRGSGDLEWSVEQGAIGSEFFTVTSGENSLSVALAAPPGTHTGWIWIRGTGGEVRIEVRADVVARRGLSAPTVELTAARQAIVDLISQRISVLSEPQNKTLRETETGTARVAGHKSAAMPPIDCQAALSLDIATLARHLSEGNIELADQESIRLIRASSGHQRIDSAEKAKAVPADLLMRIDELWSAKTGSSVDSRTWFSLASFRAGASQEVTTTIRFLSFTTWLECRLREVRGAGTG